MMIAERRNYKQVGFTGLDDEAEELDISSASVFWAALRCQTLLWGLSLE